MNYIKAPFLVNSQLDGPSVEILHMSTFMYNLLSHVSSQLRLSVCLVCELNAKGTETTSFI